MNWENPSRLYVVLDGLLGAHLLSFVFRRFAVGLGLTGSEAVLEFGAGTGNVTRYLAPLLCRGERLTCVDISRPLLAIAKRRVRRHPNVEFILGRIERLDLPEGAYDKAVVHYVLHEIPEVERPSAVGALAAALKPGGMLHLREPTWASHGIAPTAVRELLAGAGLVEISLREHRLLLVERVCTAVFAKPELKN